MPRDELVAAQVTQVNRDIPVVERHVRALTAHVRFLTASGDSGAVDGRDLLRCLDDARQEAMQLRHKLSSLAEQAAQVRRRSLGSEAYGQFQSNTRGSLRNVDRALQGLFDAVEQLQSLAAERINDAGRWGDAAAPGALADFVGLMQTLLEFWRLERVRQKLTAS